MKIWEVELMQDDSNFDSFTCIAIDFDKAYQITRDYIHKKWASFEGELQIKSISLLTNTINK